MHGVKRRDFLLLGTAGLLATGSVAAPGRQARSRERILLDTGWRFRKDEDPSWLGRLNYDVRPEVKASADGKAADARPEAAERQAAQASGPAAAR